MNVLTQENDKVKRRLEQAFDDMNKRDNDLNTLQRRFNDLESELEKERMNSEKLRRDNETICQVSISIPFFSPSVKNPCSPSKTLLTNHKLCFYAQIWLETT